MQSSRHPQHVSSSCFLDDDDRDDDDDVDDGHDDQ